MPNKNNVPKIPIPNKVVITISADNNRLFNLSIFLILFVILINSETFTFYHPLENDVEVALIAANVKVKMKINTATFSNPILTLNIIFKKNFPTANNLFVFVITSTPFLKFIINQLNIFCLPDSKIEQNKSRRFLQPEKSNSYEGRIFARTRAVLANPSMFLAHQFIVFLVTLNPLVAMLFSLEGRSNTQFIYSISSRYSFVINSYQEILLETSKQKMFNLKFKNIYALFRSWYQ